jgi:hypothetical protein
MAYMQFRMRDEDQYKMSLRAPGGQFEYRVGAFGLHDPLHLLKLLAVVHALKTLRRRTYTTETIAPAAESQMPTFDTNSLSIGTKWARRRRLAIAL